MAGKRIVITGLGIIASNGIGAEVTLDAKFFEDLGVDSMTALEIMAGIEKKYKIAIPEEKLTQLTTLRETIEVAKEYLAKKESVHV